MKTLKVGEKAPVMPIADETGNMVSISDYKGKKLVVFFYPKANTPTCTVEACNLRDNYKELINAGFEIIGVSPDSQRKQANFKKKFNFPYPLLADVDRELIAAFGIWGEKTFMGRTFDGLHRKTFVIDENGFIEQVIDKVKAKEHATQILESIKA